VISLLLAGAVSIVVSLVGTPLLIRWLQANGIGQPILEELAHAHVVKTGTPTMGGLTIVLGALAGYLAGHASGQIFTWGGMATIGLMLGAGATGLCDDWIKVRNERNLGLSKRAKSLGLVLASGGF
jgi:phospho-N-acetylmuramoyl-pentapeptide-transferase